MTQQEFERILAAKDEAINRALAKVHNLQVQIAALGHALRTEHGLTVADDDECATAIRLLHDQKIVGDLKVHVTIDGREVAREVIHGLTRLVRDASC